MHRPSRVDGRSAASRRNACPVVWRRVAIRTTGSPVPLLLLPLTRNSPDAGRVTRVRGGRGARASRTGATRGRHAVDHSSGVSDPTPDHPTPIRRMIVTPRTEPATERRSGDRHTPDGPVPEPAPTSGGGRRRGHPTACRRTLPRGRHRPELTPVSRRPRPAGRPSPRWSCPPRRQSAAPGPCTRTFRMRRRR